MSLSPPDEIRSLCHYPLLTITCSYVIIPSWWNPVFMSLSPPDDNSHVLMSLSPPDEILSLCHYPLLTKTCPFVIIPSWRKHVLMSLSPPDENRSLFHFPLLMKRCPYLWDEICQQLQDGWHFLFVICVIIRFYSNESEAITSFCKRIKIYFCLRSSCS